MKKSKASGRRTRRVFSSEFKAKVALAAVREDKTLAQLCQQFELHPNQIMEWKKQLLARAADVFDGGKAPDPVDLAPLHAKIGQQTWGHSKLGVTNLGSDLDITVFSVMLRNLSASSPFNRNSSWPAPFALNSLVRFIM